MDEENFIKIEHDSDVRINQDFENYYLNQFYDQSSNQNFEFNPIKKQDLHCSYETDSNEIIECLEEAIDIRTISIPDIISYAQEKFKLSDHFDWKQLETNLRKRKVVLKRMHAKARLCKAVKKQIYVISDNVQGIDVEEQLQAEIKKKRNRMSAQISRDRRKIKIQQLEDNNKKLKQETEKMLKQNQKLKRQLQEFNKSEEKKIQSCKGKNKFLSILIMLGIFFLLNIIRDSFKSTHENIKVADRIGKTGTEVVSAEEQSKIIEESQKVFKEIEITNSPVFGEKKLFESLMFRLEEIKTTAQDVSIHKSLKQELHLIKRSIN